MIDPTLLVAPFPGNQIPTSRISPVFLHIHPDVLPASELRRWWTPWPATFNFTEPTFSKQTNIFARVDQRFSDKHSLFVDYTYDASPCGVNICFSGSLPTVGFRLGYRRDQNAA